MVKLPEFHDLKDIVDKNMEWLSMLKEGGKPLWGGAWVYRLKYG